MSGIKSYLRDPRIFILIIIAVAFLILDLHFGLHLGIEFVGGTEIPLTLQHSVNSTTMSTIQSIIEQRVSKFGLKQVVVEPIGSSQIDVELPSVSPAYVNSTIAIIESQGRFDGIVNGKEAINGSDILNGSIGIIPAIESNGTVDWGVTFYITQSAAESFAKIVYGQANQPLYMFLDRPSNAILLINQSVLDNVSSGLTPAQSLAAAESSLNLTGSPIPILLFSNGTVNSTEAFISGNRDKYNMVITDISNSSSIIGYIRAQNYTVKTESKKNMTPQYTTISVGRSVVNVWPAVGLLSSPVLNPSITNGTISESYQISGISPITLTQAQQISYANNESKTIASILSGGALPVGIVVNTPTTLSPTLGKSAFKISILALILAVVLVSIMIVIRYRSLFLIGPILMTTIMELFIIVSIIGLVGTIDLAALAGMIAVVGTGVDAQIIITDEILSRSAEHGSSKVLLGHAFYIVWTDALLIIMAMLPLFFSTSLTQVVGFSESAIIGALMGVMITRPAYGAIVSRHESS